MAVDAYDPGPNGDYPYWPRLADGSPDPERMPTGMHWQLVSGGRRPARYVLVDMTPRTSPDGTPISPPTIPPTP